MKRYYLLVLLALIFIISPAIADIIPPFSNVVEMGSSFSGTQVSMATIANENHVSNFPDIPSSMGYSVTLSGVGTASAWINAHIMEGRTGGVFNNMVNPLTGLPVNPGFWNFDNGQVSQMMQSVDLVYHERTTASGVILSFEKSMTITDMNNRF